LENDVEEEDWMKRAIFLATAALLVMLILAPVALAQDTTMMGGQTQAPGGKTMAQTQAPGGKTAGKPLPPSGGPEILLPAAALLLGSGVLTYAVLRRR
jgi:ABC-type cobalt transport system substrate-binding protein